MNWFLRFHSLLTYVICGLRSGTQKDASDTNMWDIQIQNYVSQQVVPDCVQTPSTHTRCTATKSQRSSPANQLQESFSLPPFEVQEEVGFVSEFPPLVSRPYNPATPQCEMSAVSSKEIRKERGRPGRFQQCLPRKQRLMTTDFMSSLCLESEIVT